MLTKLFLTWLISRMLLQTFKKRAADIADYANNPRGGFGEGTEFLRGLDEAERQRPTFHFFVKTSRFDE